MQTQGNLSGLYIRKDLSPRFSLRVMNSNDCLPGFLGVTPSGPRISNAFAASRPSRSRGASLARAANQPCSIYSTLFLPLSLHLLRPSLNWTPPKPHFSPSPPHLGSWKGPSWKRRPCHGAFRTAGDIKGHWSGFFEECVRPFQAG